MPFFVHIAQAGTSRYVTALDGGFGDARLVEGAPGDGATFDIQGISPLAVASLVQGKRLANSEDYALQTYRSAYLQRAKRGRANVLDARGTLSKGKLRVMRYGAPIAQPFGRGTIQSGADVAIGVRDGAPGQYRWLTVNGDGTLGFGSPRSSPEHPETNKFQLWYAPTITRLDAAGGGPIVLGLPPSGPNVAPQAAPFTLALSQPAPPGGAALMVDLATTFENSSALPLPENATSPSAGVRARLLGTTILLPGAAVRVVVPEGSRSVSGVVFPPTPRPSPCVVGANAYAQGSDGVMRGAISALGEWFRGWDERETHEAENFGYRQNKEIELQFPRSAVRLDRWEPEGSRTALVLPVVVPLTDPAVQLDTTVRNAPQFSVAGPGPFRLTVTVSPIQGFSAAADIASVRVESPVDLANIPIVDHGFRVPVSIKGLKASKDVTLCVNVMVETLEPTAVNKMLGLDMFALHLLARS